MFERLCKSTWCFSTANRTVNRLQTCRYFCDQGHDASCLSSTVLLLPGQLPLYHWSLWTGYPVPWGRRSSRLIERCVCCGVSASYFNLTEFQWIETRGSKSSGALRQPSSVFHILRTTVAAELRYPKANVERAQPSSTWRFSRLTTKTYSRRSLLELSWNSEYIHRPLEIAATGGHRAQRRRRHCRLLRTLSKIATL